MASKNDITGDAIRSKYSEAYANNYDAIFRKKPAPQKEKGSSDPLDETSKDYLEVETKE